MAKLTTTVTLLLITIIAALSATTTTARPCKTIFFITTTTTSSTSFNNNHNQNPNHLTFFITEIHQFHRHHHHQRPIFPQHDVVSTKPLDSSLKDRTIDIMSIVGSLLFGVGCGAFTAAVMYSIWYFCSDRTDDDVEDFDSEDDDFHDVEGNRNGDYVAVANAEKQVPPTADEVDAMKK